MKLWTRLPGPAGSTCGAAWLHPTGARVTHCGHPTALYPYQAFRADGSLVWFGHDQKGRPYAMFAVLHEAQEEALDIHPPTKTKTNS